MKSPAELTELFRNQGLKVTPQRQRIFSALYGNLEHPTAESVYASVINEMPTISLRTVYQTLNDLASMGELVHLEFGNGSGRFDTNLDRHHHLVCDECSKVVDVDVDATAVRVPSSGRTGFTVTSTQIVFRGSCAECENPLPRTKALPTTKHEEQLNA